MTDPVRARTVARIFDMYRTGYSYLTIAKTLNDEGVPPPPVESKRTNKFWKKGTIREMAAERRVHRRVDLRQEEVEA